MGNLQNTDDDVTACPTDIPKTSWGLVIGIWLLLFFGAQTADYISSYQKAKSNHASKAKIAKDKNKHIDSFEFPISAYLSSNIGGLILTAIVGFVVAGAWGKAQQIIAAANFLSGLGSQCNGRVERIVSGGISDTKTAVSDALKELNSKISEDARALESAIRTILYRVLHIYPQHLLSGPERASGDAEERSLTNALKMLVENESGRAWALDFAIESFQTVKNQGFLLINTTVFKYVKYLIRGIRASNDYVFAICRVRPFWFLADQNQGVGGYDVRGLHLHMLREARNVPKRVRLVILTPKEVELIIADAYRAISLTGTKIPCGEDLPEIRWFSDDPNSDGVQLLWALSEKKLTKLHDMMVFDGSLTLSFDFTREAMGNGDMALSWSGLDSTGILSHVSTYVDTVYRGVKNDYTFFGEDDPGDMAKTFWSFRDLLKHLDANGAQHRYLVHAINTLSDEIGEHIWPGRGKQDRPTTNLEIAYLDLARAIDNGHVFYPTSKVTIRIPQDSGSKIDSLDVSWLDNREKLEKLSQKEISHW